uniref:Acyl-CoA dehydrogenase n=1 Tax=Panagrolaimus sp. JU765 TaxID=591449 RepID=A0AC34PZ59_9BILA
MLPIKTTHAVPLFRLSSKTVLRMSSTDYKHAKIGPFLQDPPVLENPFTADPVLSRALKQLLPASEYAIVEKDLTSFGDRIVKEVDQLGYLAEFNAPTLQQFDSWGKRVDKLNLHPSWNRLKEISAEEGLINIGYDETRDAVHRRLHQMAKLYLFHPSSGLVSCPLAMTDGAAKTIKELNLFGVHPDLQEAYERLISRDPKKAWTSGQWMTEKAGGSDVGGGCDTYAESIDDLKHTLHGYKWFSSAIDADITLTLARPVKQGNTTPGSKGLALFFARVRDPLTGELNGIQMLKLKNKLGTKQLPTAELLLDGVKALKLSETGRGVPSIANMLNITRVHNALASAGGMRRVISLARDYSTRRTAFGNKLYKWPLHLKELSNIELHARGGLLLALEAARLLGIQETGKATTEEQHLLRLVTPVVKLHTGKICIPAISEGIENFGGQGYIEDTGIPNILRDTQVTAIWEGTTNVLSLDVLRVFSTTKFEAVSAFSNKITKIINETKNGDEKLVQCGDVLLGEINKFLATLKTIQKDPEFPNNLQRGARDIGLTIGNIYTGALLTSFASHKDSTEADKEVAHRYCTGQKLNIVNDRSFDKKQNDLDYKIIFENYTASKL